MNTFICLFGSLGLKTFIIIIDIHDNTTHDIDLMSLFAMSYSALSKQVHYELIPELDLFIYLFFFCQIIRSYSVQQSSAHRHRKKSHEPLVYLILQNPLSLFSPRLTGIPKSSMIFLFIIYFQLFLLFVPPFLRYLIPLCALL